MNAPVASYADTQMPYPGLRSFHRSEFDIFYGRDEHVSQMLGKLGESHFLCVTGPSGCGKSSLARTGLFNALEAGFLSDRGSDWIYCDLYPETDPLGRLSAALAQAVVMGESGRGAPEPDDRQAQVVDEMQSLFQNHIDRRSSNLTSALDRISLIGDRPIVILVDQFEEIFRYAQDDPSEASRFVDVLLKTAAAKANVYVVITIRTDELEKCSRYSGLTGAINQSQFLTPTLDRFQMQEAVEGPISLFNGTIAPDLSIWLLNGLEEQLDKLPLMQHALRLLYLEARRKTPDGPVTVHLSDFFKVFGFQPRGERSLSDNHDALRRSLSHRLDTIYDSLSEPDRLIARRLFCALTTVNSRARDIRHPIKLGLAAEALDCSFERLVSVVSAFKDGSESYLRIAGEHDGIDPGDTVDVVHECILRLWRPLQQNWLPEESESAANIRFLARLAKERDASARSATIERLLGTGLLRGSTRRKHRNWWQARKPNAAWAARYLDHLNWEDGERELSPREVFGRVESFVAASEHRANYAKFVFGSVAVAGIGIAAVFVSSQVRLAQAEAEAARNLIEAQDAALDLKNAQRELLETKLNEQQLVLTAISAIAPGPSVPDPVALAHDAINGLEQALATLDEDEDGRIIAAEKLYGALSYIQELRRFTHGTDDVYAAAFLGDGSRFVTLTKALDLTLWDAGDNSDPRTVLPLADQLSRKQGLQGRSMAVAPDGTIAVGTQRGAVLLVEDFGDAASPARFTELYSGREEWLIDSVTKLDFSRQGDLLVAVSLTGHLHVWRRGGEGTWQRDGLFATGNLRARIGGAPVVPADGSESAETADRLWSVALAPDASFVALGLDDGTVCLTTLDGTQVRCSETAHTQPVKALGFSPDGRFLVSGGNDDVLRIWQPNRSQGPKPVGAALELPRLDLSLVALWQDSDIWDVDFSPDGTYLAATSWDGSTHIYETELWRPRTVLRGHTQSPRTVDFGPRDHTLLTGALDNTARTWTPFSSRLSGDRLGVTQTEGDESQIHSVALGPEADWMAYTDRRSVWIKDRDGDSRKVQSSVGDDRVPSNLAAAREGDMFIVALSTPELRIWRRDGNGAWTETEVRLTGDDVQGPRRLRKVAISQDGTRYATETTGPDGHAILVCDTEAVRCGSARGDHVARVDFPEHVDASWEGRSGCNRPGRPTALALSSDGTRLAAGGTDCNIRLFDLTSGNDPDATPQLGDYHVGNITALDFSPDDDFIVAASADWHGSVWTPATGAVARLIGHRTGVSDASVLPSGRFVATVSNDEHMMIWDSATGRKMLDMPASTDSIHTLDVAATQEGARLAAGTRGGDILVPRFFEEPQGILEFAKRTLGAIEGTSD